MQQFSSQYPKVIDGEIEIYQTIKQFGLALLLAS